MKPRKNRLKFTACVIALVFVSLVVTNAHHLSRSRRPAVANRGAEIANEPLTDVVERYAPFIYAATEKCGGRQDIISNNDFDGDLAGNNNWENFDRFELKPTVYYAVLESETSLLHLISLVSSARLGPLHILAERHS